MVVREGNVIHAHDAGWRNGDEPVRMIVELRGEVHAGSTLEDSEA